MRFHVEFVALLLTASSILNHAFAESEIRGTLLSPFNAPIEAAPTPSTDKATLPPIESGITNGSFEQLTSGLPVGWERIGFPVTQSDLASEGLRSALVNNGHWYQQRFSFSIPAWQTVALAVDCYSEVGGLSPPIYLQASGTGILENPVLVPRDPLPGGQWIRTATSYTRKPNYEQLLMIMRTRSGDWWQSVDNAEFLFEGVQSSPQSTAFADFWNLEGGALHEAGGRGLILTNQASASQDLAHSPHAVHYFIEGAGTGTFTVAEERFTLAGVSVPMADPTPVTLPESGGDFLVELPRSPTATRSTLRLAASGDGGTISLLSRGWTAAWPEVFEPVENSPSATVHLAAAWPGEGQLCTITIRDENGDAVQVLDSLQRDRDSFWTEWDGGGFPAGVYTIEFALTSGANRTVRLGRTVTLLRGAPYPAAPTPRRFDRFQSMPWLFLNDGPEDANFTTLESAVRLLQTVKDDGFTLPLIICPAPRIPMMVEAAEIVGTPFAIATTAVTLGTVPVQGNQVYDPRAALAAFETYFGAYKDHPLLEGILVSDESNLNAALMDQANRLALLMEREGWPTPLITLSGAHPLQGGRPAIHLAHIYGSNYATMTTQYEDVHVAAALAAGNDFWFGPQTFGQLDRVPMLSPEHGSAALGLGLALGGRGYYTFLYASLYTSAGLRTFQLDPSRQLSAFQDFNRRVAALDPFLREVGGDRTKPAQNGVIVRLGRDAEGRAVCFLVNSDATRPLDVTSTWQDFCQLRNAETGELLEGEEITFNLAPGAWAVMVAENGAEPTDFTGVTGAPPTPLPNAPVAVLQQITTERGARSVSLRADGRRLAVLAASNLSIYTLEPGDVGRLIDRRYFGNSFGRVEYQEDGTLLVGTSGWGLMLLRENSDGTFTIVFERLRSSLAGHTGLAVGSAEWWVTHSFMGASLVDFTDSTFGTTRQFVPPESYGWEAFYRVREGASFLAVDRVHGAYRFTPQPGGAPPLLERLTPSGMYDAGSRSPGGTFAMGARNRGFMIIREPEGRVTRIDDAALLNPDKTAWLDDETIVVDDLLADLKFYRVAADDSVESLGVWKPPVSAAHGISASRTGLLAVGTRETTLYLLDASELLSPAPNGWMLLGD